jgi:ATP-binding protein involved in chromosome partitioning
MPLSESQVLDVLRSVHFPGLSRDIVSFGFVKEVRIDGENVWIRLELTTENPSVGEEIRQATEKALRTLPEIGKVEIALVVRTPSQPLPSAGAAPLPQRPEIATLAKTRFKVAVASGKGGVGKSTVAANLALALAGLGYKVGLMDSDIYGPSQQMMMGVTEKPWVDEHEKIVPVMAHGVKVISLGMLMDADQPVIWRGPMVMRAVEQFLADVAWGENDFLVIDLPPGTGDAQLTLTQKIELSGAVIVTTPQDVALIDARKGLSMFEKVGVRLLGVIENMSGFVCPSCGHREDIFKSGGGRETAKSLGVPFLGAIPIDPRIVTGGDSGQPVVASHPGSEVARAFVDVARAVAKAVGA